MKGPAGPLAAVGAVVAAARAWVVTTASFWRRHAAVQALGVMTLALLWLSAELRVLPVRTPSSCIEFERTYDFSTWPMRWKLIGWRSLRAYWPAR